MNREEYALYNKIYNDLVGRKVSIKAMKEPDKYEREDAFMSIVIDIDKGVEPYEAFKESFKLVHEVELSRIVYESAYGLCKGFNK